MAEEIIFSDYQAEVFNEAEGLLRTQGYLGEQLFEDTYVLQKRLADWVIDAVPVVGSASSLMSEATNAYNGVLGIATDEAPAPVIETTQSEPIRPDVPVSVRPILSTPRPSFGVTAIRPVRPMPVRPMKPIKPAIATPIASTPPPRVVRPVPTSITRPNRTTPIGPTLPTFGGIGNGLFGGIFGNRNGGRSNGGGGIFGNGFGGFGG